MFADVSSHDSGGMGKSDADAVSLYVNDLERALLGADPALIHDALIDAESHLRAAIASGTPALAAIEAFGTPSDIALAYFREQLSSARDGVKEFGHAVVRFDLDGVGVEAEAQPVRQLSLQSGHGRLAAKRP